MFKALTNGGLAVLGLCGVLILTSCSPEKSASTQAAAAPPVTAKVAGMRRLTSAQYQNIVADIFGTRIAVVGQFDPLVRTDGLLAVSASNVMTTPSGFEQFESVARSIAAQIVGTTNRKVLVPCVPATADAFDAACTRGYFATVGRLLFRRALTNEELDGRVGIAQASAKSKGDYYAGVEAGLSSLLMSPSFLFINETMESDPQHPGKQRLDAYSKASRVSFLLWDTTPDDDLLASAERGDLNDERELARQVDRMIGSDRVKRGVTAFFADMLSFDKFADLEKDTTLYPAFSLAANDDARRQLMMTITDILVTQHGDYRDLFTTRRTYLSDSLARLYRVPAPVPGGWGVYEFPAGDQRIGIQTEVGFTSLFAHPGRSSPTLRGKAIRELLLCQRVPDPPGNVDFSLLSSHTDELRTARQRLTMHATNAACSGCHKIMDPIGLALENFDGAGQFRTSEDGAAIDTTGELDGVRYENPAQLAVALSKNPAIPSCVVNRLYAYSLGRSATPAERAYASKTLEPKFASSGYRFPELLRAIATDENSYVVPDHLATTASAKE